MYLKKKKDFTVIIDLFFPFIALNMDWEFTAAFVEKSQFFLYRGRREISK